MGFDKFISKNSPNHQFLREIVNCVKINYLWTYENPQSKSIHLHYLKKIKEREREKDYLVGLTV